jgi:hypothetical protein
MRTSARIWGIFIVIIKRKKKSPAKNWGIPAKIRWQSETIKDVANSSLHHSVFVRYALL